MCKMGLGDNFPRKKWYVKKSALGVGLTEPQTVINYLAIKLCVGYNKSKCDLTSVINMHEDVYKDDIVLPRKFRKLKHLKAGWIEEIEDRFQRNSIIENC